jgi:type II secretory pathway pseudopilin PulG
MNAMKKTVKTMLGVTLLEIMLVLAIAAMIIVMSIRYYQSASSAQQANAIIEQIQAIVAAADSLAQSSGSYQSANLSANLKTLLPSNAMSTPWGGAINVSSNSASSYTIKISNPPTAVCLLMVTRLKTNNHFSLGTCAAGSDFNLTYTANP